MATVRFQINAGVASRGAVKRAIKSYCFEQDIDCHVEEDKGFFGSQYYFTLRGTNEQMIQAKHDIDRWSEQF